jgi:uridine kinase
MSMIIGVGGVSRSGKTWLAYKITELFKDRTIAVINQDEYVYDIEEIPRVNGETDWECPESIDFDHLLDHIQIASASNDVVIVEGLLAFYDKRIMQLMDKKLFIEIPKPLFLKRKIKDKRWGDFPEWYMEHIWQSYLKYGKIDRGNKEFYFLSGEDLQFTDNLIAYLLDG